MKRSNGTPELFMVFSIFVLLILGCSGISVKRKAEWTRSKKIAGSEQGLSHVSGLVADDKFAYVTIGGTVADEQTPCGRWH